MAALLPKNRALDDQILAVVKAEEGVPVATFVIADRVKGNRVGVTPSFHMDVYRSLVRLMKRGLVHRDRFDSLRSAYWRAS